MNKRLLSIFLTLCMALTLLPFSAIAEENDTYDYSGGEITAFETPETTEQTFPTGTAVTTGSAMVAEIIEPEAKDEIMVMVMDGVARIDSDSYYTLQSAINAVQEGQTIQLLSNINLASTVTIAEDNNKSFSIDLNGKTIDGGNAITIQHNGGKLTIKDSASEGKITSNVADGTIHLFGGSLVALSGTIENTCTSNFNAAISNVSAGSVSVEGGTVKALSSVSFAIANHGTGSVIVSSGTLISGFRAIVNPNSGKVAISGGEVKSNIGEAIANLSTGEVSISGGKMDSISGTAISNFPTGKVTIQGGSAVISGGQMAMYVAPDLSSYENVHVTASTNYDGSSPTTYNPENISSYKYLKFETGTTPPSITLVNRTNAEGTYTKGDALSFLVNFSDSVTVNTVSGTPYLRLRIGTNIVNAYYAGGSGTPSLMFIYTVQAGDLDNDGIECLSPLTLNGSTIRGAEEINAVLTFLPPDTAGIKVDTAPSAITGTVTISGTPKYGETLTAAYNGGNNTGELSYQWKRNGNAIHEATNNIYTIAQADIGHTLTCEVTSSIETGTALSAATASISKADGPSSPTGLAGVSPTGSDSQNGKITGTNTLMEYSLHTDFSNPVNCEDSETTMFDGGTTWYVRFKATDTHEAGAYATVHIPEYAPSLLTGTANIDNTTPRIGDTLTASLVGGNNSGTLTYIWKAGGEQIGTGTSYAVTATDLGKTITLEITSSIETGKITSSATSAVLKKTAPSAPGAPSLSSKTHNSITLSANAAYEFSKDGITWQKGNIFSGLAANKAYTFYQRVAETSEREASEEGSGLTVTTDSITGGGGSSGGGGGGGSTTPKPVIPTPLPQPPVAPVTPIFIEYPTISNMMIPNITPGVLEALNGFVVPESLVKGIELPEALNTISVEGRIPNFADTGNHWAGDTINKAVERGLLNGVSEREFAPKSNLTLEQTLVGFNNVFLKNNMIQMKVKREYLENRLNEYLKNETWSTLAVVQTLGNTDLETIEKIAQQPQVLKQTITRGELADYLLKLTGDILDAKDMTPEEFCKTYGFMVGDADGNFSAERVLKRAELAAILLRVDNELMSSDDREAGPEQQNIN